jgi:hypothetical protein
VVDRHFTFVSSCKFQYHLWIFVVSAVDGDIYFCHCLCGRANGTLFHGCISVCDEKYILGNAHQESYRN